MISGYRLMWLMVMFDLPVLTKEERRNYRRFVDHLEDDGYSRMQFSVYARPCATDENTLVHSNRLLDWLPPDGEVRILKFTDKQWARMTVYREASRVGTELPPEQFTFFDEDLAPVIDESASREVEHRIQVVIAEAASLPEQRTGNDVANLRVAEEKNAKLEKKGQRRKRQRNETPSFDFFD